jgi:M6 family metalloprotease-like protein/uncharacterized repeat protein (TIGR02543 family)
LIGRRDFPGHGESERAGVMAPILLFVLHLGKSCGERHNSKRELPPMANSATRQFEPTGRFCVMNGKRAPWFRVSVALLLALVGGTVSGWAAPTGPQGVPVEAQQPDGTVLTIRGYGDEFYHRYETTDGYTVIRDQQTNTWHYAQASTDGSTLLSSGLVVGRDHPAAAGLTKHANRSREAIGRIIADRHARFVVPANWERRRLERQITRLHGLGSQTAASALVQTYNARYQAMGYRASLPASGAPRLTSATEPNYAPPPAMARTSVVALCILVKFPDQAAPAFDQAEMDDLVNQEDYTDAAGNSGSVRDYFYAQSFGKLTYTAVVTNYITADHNRSHYANQADCDGGLELIRECIGKVSGVDLTPLTKTSGTAVAVYLLYAGATGYDGLWPHQSTLYPTPSLSDGTKVADYMVSSIGTTPVIGTICHESGHMVLGCADYYDYGDDGVASAGVGEHCLMGSGNHLNDGKTPAPLNAYLKYKLGFAAAVPLPASGSVSVGANDQQFYRVVKPGKAAEYFILENKCKSASPWNAGMVDEGLAVWHVDEAVTTDNEYQQMTIDKHYELSLEQADGQFDLETKTDTNRGDDTDYYDGATGRTAISSSATTPSSKWWDGGSSGSLAISNVSTPGATVRFIISQAVTLDPEGGTVSPTGIGVVFNTPYGTLPTPNRNGYSFDGWWTGDNGTGTQVTAGTMVTTAANHTLYAKWTPNSYTVTFDPENGTVTPETMGVTFGAAYGTLPTPVRTGYTFAGWWTSDNGTGNRVTATTLVAATADLRLYARWTVSTYTVTFDSEGGRMSTTSKSVAFGGTYGALPTPARTGYVFAGWWTGDNGTDTQVLSTTVVTIPANHALYAKWMVNSYTVTFSPGGGTVSPTSQGVTFDAPYGPLPAPIRTDYTFDGWWTGTSVTENTVVSIAASHTLYAKWVRKGSQTITFPALPAKTYGNADFAPGATASSTLAVSYASNNPAVATVVAGNLHLVGAGTATITASQPGDGTWTAATAVAKTLTVAKKTLTVTAENKNRTTNEPTPAFSIVYAGWVNGDQEAVLATPPTATCSATAASQAGTYPITVGGGSDANYAFSYVAGTLTITAVYPAVTTTVPTAIGTTTATAGGTVTSDGGTPVTARGVCWSTATTPTLADARTSNGNGMGAFTSMLGRLRASTTYYVRAYATNGAGTAYGEPRAFTTPAASGADFVVTTITLLPGLPAVSGKLTVSVTVLNQGLLSGKAGSLYVWTNKPETAAMGEPADKSAALSTLKPGLSKTVKMTVTAPASLGTFTLRAFIDAKNAAKEDDEYNNQSSYAYSTGLPDFAVQAVQISPETPAAGQAFTAYVTVVNSGAVAGNAGSLDLWADTTALPTPPVPASTIKGNKYKTVGTLLPGQEKTITVTGLKAPVGQPAPGLGVLIDSRAKTREMDETNNAFEFDYNCQ